MVLAAYPAAFDDSLPFLNVTRLLEQMPVPVPDILDEAPDLGLLLLEDLGDVTLQAHLGLASSEEHGKLYREAVRLIAACSIAARNSPRMTTFRMASPSTRRSSDGRWSSSSSTTSSGTAAST